MNVGVADRVLLQHRSLLHICSPCTDWISSSLVLVAVDTVLRQLSGPIRADHTPHPILDTHIPVIYVIILFL